MLQFQSTRKCVFALNKNNMLRLLYCIIFLLDLCWAQVNDGHYSAEDDAQVLPIVLPIVLVVVIVCIIACCWQGKKCPCNKENKPKPNNTAAQANAQVTVENEKKASSTKAASSTRNTKPQYNSSPPPYSTAVQYKSTELPGRSSAKHTTSEKRDSSSHAKRSSHSTRSQSHHSHAAVEAASKRRSDDKYRVVDHRSGKDSSKSRYAKENDGYIPEEKYSSRRSQHREQQYYYDRS